MAKMTKAQARKRLIEIQSKALRLLELDYISVKDYAAIGKICRDARKRIGR
jgi:hypothetical protein